MRKWLIRLVAGVPATAHAKLLAAFLAMVALLITLGVVGLHELSTANRRAEALVNLQQKIVAYRELQHDALVQNDSVSTALMVPSGELQYEFLLRQVKQFRSDFDRLRSLAKDAAQFLGPVPQENQVLSQILSNDDQLIKIVAYVVDVVRRGHVAEGRDRLMRAAPLADQLELSTGKLVVLADAEMAASIKQIR
jgi:hypothetical protein